MRIKTLCTIGLAAGLLPMIAWTQGRYVPPAQPQKGPPCGHYLTPPCDTAPAAVSIPPGATAEQIFQMGAEAFAQRRFSVASGFMEQAAAMGHTRAQAALGLAFVNGQGEPKDLAKAMYWLNLAAEKGHRVAEAELGDLYEDGDGVPQDLTKAFHYHQLGAAQGWWQAELRLGLEYELGYGTPRSRAEALRWLDRATNDGRDGLSQGLAIMLRRSDTPARFRDLDQLAGYYGRLLGQAYLDSLPKIPAGKNCREHYIPGGSAQSTYFCS